MPLRLNPALQGLLLDQPVLSSTAAITTAIDAPSVSASPARRSLAAPAVLAPVGVPARQTATLECGLELRPPGRLALAADAARRPLTTPLVGSPAFPVSPDRGSPA
ncbi:MAG TPA: hypothetical protein VFY87_27390 [Geminicoccaceae bacterium]|nr:hypothetical protein [Geminicoccaceae bacterium]